MTNGSIIRYETGAKSELPALLLLSSTSFRGSLLRPNHPPPIHPRHLHHNNLLDRNRIRNRRRLVRSLARAKENAGGVLLQHDEN